MEPIPELLFGPFRLDGTNAQLWRDQQPLALTPKAFAVLHHLVTHANRVVTKEELLEVVWSEIAVSEAVLKVCIGEIRKALGESARAPQYITTVYRRGYRFMAAVTLANPPFISSLPLSPSPPLLSSSVPLVGREHALAQLRHGLVRALHHGRQLIFVTGEPGIGKTTLVETFVAHVTADMPLWLARGQCIEHYGVGEPYLPVLEAVGRLCRAPEHAQGLALLRQHAPTWLAQMPSLLSAQDRAGLHHELVGATRERMLREIVAWVDAVAAVTPLILVLEDLHWSDYATLDLLTMLARRREPARLLVLGTYRPVETIVRQHPLREVQHALQMHGQCCLLPLELLSATEVAHYLAKRFVPHHFPTVLAQVLYQRTDGNPFFMVQVVEDWLRQGLLQNQHGAWELHGEIAAARVGVPESIVQLLGQHIERLSPEEQQVLEAASVVGAEFSAAAVAAGLETDVLAVETHCEEIVRRYQVLQPLGTSVWPDGTLAGRYAFRHTLYQQVVYQRPAQIRCVRFHRRIGAHLEAAYGAQVDEIATELAMHFERGRQTRRAVHYLLRTAEHATRRYAHREAIGHLTQGLTLLKTLPDTLERSQHELTFSLALGVALAATRGYSAPDVAYTYGRAWEICQQLEDIPQSGPILQGLWDCHLVRAELHQARALAQQLLATARRTCEPSLLINAHRAVGTTAHFLGELGSARAHLQQAIALYQGQTSPQPPCLSGAQPGVMSYLYMASTLWLLGYPDQARQQSDTALRLAQACAHPFSLAFAFNFATQLHQRCGDAAATRACAEAAVAVSTEYGFRFFLAWGTLSRGWALVEQGQTEAGMSQLQEGLTAWRTTGAEISRPRVLAVLAESYGQQGRTSEGLRMVEEALTAVHHTTERWWEAELYRIQGELLQQLPDASASPEACLHQALALAREQDARSFELRAAVSLCRLWQRQARHSEAQQLLTEVYQWFTEGFDTADLRAARSLLAEVQR